MEEKQAGSKLVAALCKARAEFKPIRKDAENPFFKSKYATLATYIEATEPALTANGLHVHQYVAERDGKPFLVTQILHVSGEILRSGAYPINPVKPDPQGIGSACSYARRYSYAAALNLAAEDDDGNNATKPKEEKPPIKAQDKPKKLGTVSEDDRKRIFAAAKEQGHSKGTVLAIVKQLFGVDSTADIPAEGLDALISKMEGRE